MNTLCKKKLDNYNIEFRESDNSFFIYSKDKLTSTFLINIFQNFQISIIEIENFECSDYFVYKLVSDVPDSFNEYKDNILSIIMQILNKKSYSLCKLYYLALFGTNLREIELIRAIIKYQSQILYEFNEKEIISVLIKYPLFTIDVLNSLLNNSKVNLEILKDIKDHQENRILNLFSVITQNIIKTNYFLNKDTISFKVYTKNFKSMLFGIQPNIEMFVYHKEFNGIHLRMSHIARGGIRYSNRINDFREEIKDLAITQEAKNSLIIPEGAKGGFVIFNPSKEKFKEIYSKFIDSLLDLIDFDKKGDFYFVVAADKGTSNMSDVANNIAIKRGYFLRDAFASGGSNGYSHKRIGITSKGAIETTNRFFLEKGKNIYTDEISVVGVGSMRGDVFGNGMLINPNFKLLGAISHKEIFIDPNPVLEEAYEERKRLFKENLSWSSYKKLKNGAMVINREDKEVKLTEEVKKLLNINKDIVSADEVAKKLLTLKVDLLYFGGIGTYIKASDELNLHISDKENENIRVDAKDIKAFAICEGANLAITMKGRFEYALKGGKINLDSIDNSAGVNISDYEVNIKILLNSLVDKNIITEEEKIEIIKEIEDEVVKKVLYNNYSHALLLSIDSEIVDQEMFTNILEILEMKTDYFKRHYFNIPKNSEIKNLYLNNKLIRPALAIVMQYTKIFIKKFLLKNLDIDNIYFDKFLFDYFPDKLITKYKDEAKQHLLKKEIIATNITNKIVNNLGISILYKFEEETFLLKILSFLMINEIIDIEEIKQEINNISIKRSYNLLKEIIDTFNFSIKLLVKELQKNNLNPLIFIGYKQELKEIFKAENELERFKKYKIFFIFLPSILSIQHKYQINFHTTINLFKLTFTKFKIKEILRYLYSLNIQTSIQRTIKNEIEIMIEYFIKSLITDILEKESFVENEHEKYFKKHIDNKKSIYKQIISEIEEIKNHKEDRLEFINHIVNSMVINSFK